MQAQKEWATPQLTVYGSVETLTQQVSIDKQSGSGDSLIVNIPNQPPVTIDIPGAGGGALS